MKRGATVLVVEDEVGIRELSEFHLERAGFEVVAVGDLDAAWPLLDTVEILVLDWMLPGGSGLELLTRLRALLRRVEPARRLAVGSLHIDLDRAEVAYDGARVDLTRREFELLAFLAAQPGRVYSRAELLDRVWGEAFLGTERTVDQHGAQLRARLDGLPLDPERIEELFESHARGRTAKAKGTGLGLYIVRSIAERWGGRAWGEAGADGNVFAVTVPTRRPG